MSFSNSFGRTRNSFGYGIGAGNYAPTAMQSGRLSGRQPTPTIPGINSSFNSNVQRGLNLLGTNRLKGVGLAGILNTSQRVLGTVNQVRPLINQFRPMVNNVRVFGRVLKAFGQNSKNKNQTESTPETIVTEATEKVESKEVVEQELVLEPQIIEDEVKKIRKRSSIQPPFYPQDF